MQPMPNKKWTTQDLREAFTRYFVARNHTAVPGCSLIPPGDDTLLFTNAGMVPFKDVFLGREQRPYKQATSIQACLRAGGKHNDLENVGYTARHHTLFEMLGNFSFGAYFKKEAIAYAWEFLTQVLQLPPEKLWVTVHTSDLEAEKIWVEEMKVDPKRMSRCEEDNFWAMGDTGPCGPCTEIFYDHGPDVPGGPPGSVDADGDRYVEIWNLVFMQFQRLPGGELEPLAQVAVDTGMGLERLAAVMQGVHSNYETDIFQHLIQATAKVLDVPFSMQEPSLKVVADHIRACAFMVADGMTPSNEGRGYVLRRIIRRALRHGFKLAHKPDFFSKLVVPLVEVMGKAYPQLVEKQKHIEQVLQQETTQFSKTLAQGMKVLEEQLVQLKGQPVSGELLFKLYDTYGFPLDLTLDILRERDIPADAAGFEIQMQAQKMRGRASATFAVDYTRFQDLKDVSVFSGYKHLKDEGKILSAYHEMQSQQTLTAGQEGIIILDNTPFYAESGGQVGDGGWLRTAHGVFEVHDTQKVGQAILHHGLVINGSFTVGETVQAEVNGSLRKQTQLNHSATHLMHAALRLLLGKELIQKGSLVSPHRLRFDFSYPKPVTKVELEAVEDLVNQKILENSDCVVEEVPLAEAQARGVMALFGEKYGEQVRVLQMGDGFSMELCGGTHVKHTGDIGCFVIVSETGIASGIRRIEALTGQAALQYLREKRNALSSLAQLLKTEEPQVLDRVEKQQAQVKALEKQLATFKQKELQQLVQTLAATAHHKDIPFFIQNWKNYTPNDLRFMAEQLKNKHPQFVACLMTQDTDKVHVVAAVSRDLQAQLSATALLQFMTQALGGQGGGRADMAQGSLPLHPALVETMGKLKDFAVTQLG